MTKPTMGAGSVGSPLTTNAGLKSVDTIVAQRQATAPLQVNRWVRNGKHPNALFESMKSESANVAAMYRAKEVYRNAGCFPSGTIVSPTTRWRFAFHSGPYTAAINVVAFLAPLAGSAVDSFATISLFDGTNTITETFHCGPDQLLGPLEASKAISKLIGISPDTDYFVTFTDTSSYLISATVHEYPSLTQYNAGYLPQNVAITGAILDGFRQNLAETIVKLWKRGGAQVLNWGVDDGTTALTTASATPTNIFDLSSTANTSASPGYTLDMTGKARIMQATGVPVVMKIYGQNPTGGAGAGTVSLVNSAGTNVLSVSFGGAGTGVGWYSTSGVLPATVDKYDLMFSTTSGTLSLYAVSIYEYEA